jgi:membrane-associated protein
VTADEAPTVRRRLTRRAWIALAVAGFLAVVVALQVLGGDDGLTLVDEASGDWAYFSVWLLVTLDGICAIFPGETTLNAASTLAAQGELNLWLVMVAGALGAICGDSGLYWIARRYRQRYEARVNKWMADRRVKAAMDFVGSSAPQLLIIGRYLPGMRLVVNAMFGLQAYPYKKFLLWSAIGGTTWSIYTCGLAYLIGTALVNFPLASVIISGLVTTVAIGVLFLVVRRRRKAAAAAAAAVVTPPSVEE